MGTGEAGRRKFVYAHNYRLVANDAHLQNWPCTKKDFEAAGQGRQNESRGASNADAVSI